jgi:hypothetical protein
MYHGCNYKRCNVYCIVISVLCIFSTGFIYIAVSCYGYSSEYDYDFEGIWMLISIGFHSCNWYRVRGIGYGLSRDTRKVEGIAVAFRDV